jgi:uncharacterized protein YndB with AHSA1/START domain
VEFVATARSAAPPERLFALLAAGDRWSEWAGPTVPRSRWLVPGDPEGGVGAVRRLGLGLLGSSERIVEHEPPRRLAYVVDSPAPFRDYRAVVDLTGRPDGGTDVLWSASFTPVVPGTGAALRLVLRRIVAGFAERLARAAERP